MAGQHSETVIDRKAEFNVKAAYLYNFARYVTWPNQPEIQADNRFHIGVVGESDIVVPLQKIAKFKKIQDRRSGAAKPIRLHQFASADAFTRCHILFVSESTPQETVAAIIRKTRTLPVLIVGETIDFAKLSGTAEFRLVNGGVRFDLNLGAANERQLQLDAKLLKAANSIVDRETAGSLTQK